MNVKGALIFVFLIVLLLQNNVFGQKASAELISSTPPGKLPSGEQVKDGIQNLFLKDHLLYVSNIWAGMQILDVSDVHNPKEVSTYRADRNHNIYVEDNRAYLSNELSGVDVVDVSDPSNPQKIVTIRTDGDAYWVVARYPHVFVAEESKGVNVYDISDPAAPKKVGGYDTPGWAWGLDIAGNYLYVADMKGGLIILDIGDPSQIKKVGRVKEITHAKTVQVEDTYAYVANGAEGLCIVDVSNPAFPKCISKFETGGFAYNASKSGNTVFVANEMKKMVQFVEVIDKKNPTDGGHYLAQGNVYAALKRDVYVYVASDIATLILRHNHPPVLAAISDQTVNEADTLVVTPEGYDPDGDTIFYTVTNLPKGAGFDSLSGRIVWKPTYEQSGQYPKITITAVEKTDSKLTASSTFAITVNHVNRNPLLPDVPDTVIAENATLTFVVPEGSDPDVEDKGKLTYQAENLPQGAQFDPKTRVFSWTPTFEQSGTYVVDFSIHDGAGGIMRDACTITVQHVDRKPTLEPIAAQTVNENERITLQLKGSDPDAEDQNALHYTAKNLPEGAVFNPDSALFSWTPTYDQSGVYKNIVFIFTAGALSDSISVDITVNHVNRPPLLAEIGDQTVDENKTLSFTVSGSDPDVEDEGKLVYSAENLPQGARFLTDSLKFVWTPTYEQAGIYPNVVFIVKDPSGLEAKRSITITVNHVNRPPQLADIEPQTVNENMPLTFQLVGSDPDKEDEGKLVYSADKLPEGATLDAASGTFSWTPTYEQSGVYPIKFTISDGRLSDTKETTITVVHVNRPPILATIAPQTVKENTPLTFKVEGSDPDKEDAGKWRYAAANLPQGATFDTTNATFNWTPSFEQSGTYTVTFSTTDPSGLKDEKNVTITVEHVNRTPELPEQPAQIVNENQPLEIKIVPATDPDKEDEGKISYTVENLPQGAVFDAQALTIKWTPTYEQSGEYTITLKAADQEFTVQQPIKITVNHVNRPPQIAEIADQTIDENKDWQLQLDVKDPDKEDEGKVTVTVTGLPEGAVFDPANNTIRWKPTYEQSGVYSGIKVSAADPGGLSDEKTFSITVNHVNRPPQLQPVAPVTTQENAAVNITLQASDPDKEDEGKLTYSADHLPQGAVLDASSGAFSWTPTFLQAGEYTITFKVTDSGNLSAEQRTTIKVEDVNHPPQIKEIPAQSVKENETLRFTVEGSDEDSDNTLEYSASDLPEGASFSSADGGFSWTPGYDQAGTYTVHFKVSDGKAEAAASVTITVEDVNRPPTINGPGSETVIAGESVSLSYSGDDPDGDDLTFSAVGLPSGASLSSSGDFNWTPGEDQTGSHTFTVKVSDGKEEASTSTTITVKEKPKPEPAPADTTGQ